MKNDKNKQTSNSRTKVFTTGKKQVPETDRHTRLRAHIMAGHAPKIFSINENMYSTTAGKMLNAMGIRKVYITNEEEAHIMQRRAGGAK